MAGVSSGMAGVSPGAYLTYINDNCVVGNSLASVTEMMRTAGRPLRLRFEKGVPPSDPYLYRGDVPIVMCDGDDDDDDDDDGKSEETTGETGDDKAGDDKETNRETGDDKTSDKTGDDKTGDDKTGDEKETGDKTETKETETTKEIDTKETGNKTGDDKTGDVATKTDDKTDETGEGKQARGDETPAISLLYTPSRHFHGNVLLDPAGTLRAFALKLPHSPAILPATLRFLLRRRARIPAIIDGQWTVDETPISRFPRDLVLQLLRDSIPAELRRNSLQPLFAAMNADYAVLVKRSTVSPEFRDYLESSASRGSTRELSGNCVITQREFRDHVLEPLRSQLPRGEFQLLLLNYLQSLAKMEIPRESSLWEFHRHVTCRNAFVFEEFQNDTPAVLLNILRMHVVALDELEATKRLAQGEPREIATEMAARALRGKGAEKALFGFCQRRQQLEELLLLMARKRDDASEMHLEVLSVIQLAMSLFEDDGDLRHLYRTYHFIQHACPVGVLLDCHARRSCATFSIRIRGKNTLMEMIMSLLPRVHRKPKP